MTNILKIWQWQIYWKSDNDEYIENLTITWQIYWKSDWPKYW
jgi:hypothetical protein